MPAPIHISAATKVLAMSKDNAPVARVPQNTPVSFETMDCFSNSLRSEADLFSSVGWECINPATGPVFVEGAEPGDMLRVDILDIQVAEQGIVAAAPGFGEMPDSVSETTRVVTVRDGKAYFDWKTASGVIHRELPIKPMIGVIGVAPAGEAVPTGCPDSHGGNMDCKRIARGAALYLPVNVPGALFAAGDLHALMADGEVVVCGVEIAGLVTVSFKVIKGKRWSLPALVEGGHFMTLASHESLDTAATQATRNMHRFLVSELGMDSTDAAMLLSVEGDLRICQVVDPKKTARMELPLAILREAGYELP